MAMVKMKNFLDNNNRFEEIKEETSEDNISSKDLN